jgi:ribonuclease E
MRENEADSAAGAQGTADSSNDKSDTTSPERTERKSSRPRRRAASRPAGPPPEIEEIPAIVTPVAAAPKAAEPVVTAPEPAVSPPEPAAKAGAAEPAARGKAPAAAEANAPQADAESVAEPAEKDEPAERPVKAAKTTRTRSRKREAPAPPPAEQEEREQAAPETAEVAAAVGVPAVTFQPPMVVFQPATAGPPERPVPAPAAVPAHVEEPDEDADQTADQADDQADDDESSDRPSRRRRRRGGRGRGKAKDTGDEAGDDAAEEADQPAAAAKSESAEKPGEGDADDESGSGSTRRRRRRRRRTGGGGDSDETGHDDPPNTVVHVRDARAVEDEVQSVKGSTRLEAKKQRRREGREQGRRRPPIITESEFLARREAVERVMVVRQEGERTQIAVLEDEVLVEHYVDRATHQSYVGNVYLGKVQNVLPSMEAAFVDIGKGRNAVLYAGEVNWDVAGLEGQPRRIESALRSGQSVLVQVTKDPLGHKGARLTSQVSLPGRYLVYVPDGSMTGISRKLPDKERTRLKQILKRVMPENAGVIVRTAAEGATEEELAQDVSRLAAQWENIQRQAKTATAPELLYGEPDLTIRVVRDIFNEDFSKLVVSGDEAWSMVEEYVSYVAPHLAGRTSKWDRSEDVLTNYRIDEQIAKALDRKVWLPSGGSLVIDRTEAMTVVDVNTGKFTGQGGNLEETVTRNNLEAAEEIVRQLRLRDIGGIIVVDFIDMVLESNRDLVLRRLLECLARDRTKHQVAEVTSLGLVQMTRKRVGQGLLEAFSEVCECCNGRGIHVSLTPVEPQPEQAASLTRRRKRKGEVEKVVEKKIARHEAEKTVEDEPAKAEKKSRAKGGRSRSAKGTPVESFGPIEPAEAVATRTLPGSTESAAQAAEDAADAAADPAATAVASESAGPAQPAETFGAYASGGSETGERSVEGGPLERADVAEQAVAETGPALEEVQTAEERTGADDHGDEAVAASNGRRRRPRRSRAKAEVGSEDTD